MVQRFLSDARSMDLLLFFYKKLLPIQFCLNKSVFLKKVYEKKRILVAKFVNILKKLNFLKKNRESLKGKLNKKFYINQIFYLVKELNIKPNCLSLLDFINKKNVNIIVVLMQSNYLSVGNY